VSFFSQNAHDETVLVRCAQLRAAWATPPKRGVESLNAFVRRPPVDRYRCPSKRVKASELGKTFQTRRKAIRYVFLILVDSFSHTTCLASNLLLYARH